MPDAVAKTRAILETYRDKPDYAPGIDACIKAIEMAQSTRNPGDLHVMDALPRQLGYENPFLATPVLAQTVYALLSARGKPDAEGIKSVMALAVSHSGDSDSVGAIAGNVLGARYGTGVIPKDWLSVLVQREDIEKMADDLSDRIAPPPEATPRKLPNIGL